MVCKPSVQKRTWETNQAICEGHKKVKQQGAKPPQIWPLIEIHFSTDALYRQIPSQATFNDVEFADRIEFVERNLPQCSS